MFLRRLFRTYRVNLSRVVGTNRLLLLLFRSLLFYPHVFLQTTQLCRSERRQSLSGPWDTFYVTAATIATCYFTTVVFGPSDGLDSVQEYRRWVYLFTSIFFLFLGSGCVCVNLKNKFTSIVTLIKSNNWVLCDDPQTLSPLQRAILIIFTRTSHHKPTVVCHLHLWFYSVLL